VFRHLDIKQIQVDSLSYLISDHLLNLGNVNDCEVFFHESFFLYDDNRTQTLAGIGESCIKQLYSRIPEFYELFIRLEHSIQSVGCIIETVRAEILCKPVVEMTSYLRALKTEELLFDGIKLFYITFFIFFTYVEEMVKKIRDNRDTAVLEYLDHSHMVKDQLFGVLPRFGTLSIWTYTCLTLLLKGLATNDSEAISYLHMHYNRPTYFNHELISTVDEARATFVSGLLIEMQKIDPSNPASMEETSRWLGDVFDASQQIRSICSYSSLHELEWCVEQARWSIMAFALYLNGLKPKVYRHAIRALQPCLSILKDRCNSLKKHLSKTKPASLPLDLEGADLDTFQLLESNWRASLHNIEAILNASAVLLADYAK